MDEVQISKQSTRSIIADMAVRFGMERDAFESTLKKTIMPADKNISNEQIAAFLIVAKEYDLNPFTKEIFAFPARNGGIQPIVSIDGWLKIINSHKQFDGMIFVDHITDGILSAVTCKMYRKDRQHPTEVTEYMSECRRDTDTWKKYPIRMLRHKAAIKAARYSFGYSGIVDQDEAERIVDMGAAEIIHENTIPSVPEDTQNEVHEKTLMCLEDNDGAGLKELYDQYDADTRVQLHRMFNSAQRKRIKELMEKA